MTRPFKIGLSLLAAVLGWLSIGIGYTTTMGHPTNTILFLSGMVMFPGGIIAAITWGRKK
jgi:hypothetical protein